jgi:hypothetical protein
MQISYWKSSRIKGWDAAYLYSTVQVSCRAAHEPMSYHHNPSLSSLTSRLRVASSVTWIAAAGDCSGGPCLPLALAFGFGHLIPSACFLASMLRTSCTSASLMVIRVGFRRIIERKLGLERQQRGQEKANQIAQGTCAAALQIGINKHLEHKRCHKPIHPLTFY